MKALPFLLAAAALASGSAAHAAPLAFIQAWQPDQHVSSSGGVSHTVDLQTWARQRLGSDRFQVLSGRLRLGFSDDDDGLIDRGLLGYDGQTRAQTAYRGTRDGRTGLITQRVVTDWQARGFEDEAERARVSGHGLNAVATSAGRQSVRDGAVQELAREWSGWTCHWWGCAGTETVWQAGERHRITQYDGDFSLDLDLGPAVLDALSTAGRWDFRVGAELGDFLWRHARLDLSVIALPPSRDLPLPSAFGLALAALALMRGASRRA